MKLLEQFISQTGRQPANWTSQDIQNYLLYVEKQAAEANVLKIYEHWSNSARLTTARKRRNN